MMPFPKVVENSHDHLWTDALHGRALTKQTKNRWDRGTYVRWTVMTAWNVLEMACEDVLETAGIGRQFKEKLDAAIATKGLVPIDWGSGVWQRVRAVHKARVDLVRINAAQEQLFPCVEEADRAIATIRDAITDIYDRVRKPPPEWLQDDDDKGWDQDRGTMAYAQAVFDAQVVSAGVDPKGDETVRISYEYKVREHDSDFYPAGTDPAPLIERLLKNLRIPVTAVRAYRGTTMIYERKLQMRGS